MNNKVIAASIAMLFTAVPAQAYGFANVPEPSTIGLLSLGVLSLFGARLQQRRKDEG